MRITRFALVTLFVILAAVSPGAIVPADWPQWQGPHRTGISKETGLLKEWPSAGPAALWSAQGIGGGYGSMAVAGDRVYVQGMRNGSSIVSALNRADGKSLWSKSLGRAQSNDQGDGPRGTP